MAVVAGSVLALAGCGGETETVTTTVTVTQREADIALPQPVVRKRYELLSAAYQRDFEAVAQLAASTFTYSFGGAQPGGPAAYWRRLERESGERPLAVLAALLRLPYTLHRGIYVWPFAYDKQPDELARYDRQLLRSVGGEDLSDDFAEGTGYLGWRVGIEPDGDWIFFVAGD